MAGCAKAGRQKNSASNKRYIAENRSDANKKRHIKRAEQQALTKKGRDLRARLVEAGTARKARREAWMAGVTYPFKPVMSFREFEVHHHAKR